jgi:hypothetical protein
MLVIISGDGNPTQWDKVLPYNDRFLLLYYKQYKNSVEIFVET